MERWKQVQARVEPHINRALLFAILACLVILLTYLLGGAGAFSAWPWRPGIQANAASAPAAPSPTATGGGWTAGQTVVSVAGAITLTLRVSPLDIAYNCALGASAAQQLTLTNPDGAAHAFTLSWNGPGGPAQGFVATVLPPGAGAGDTVPAHGSWQVKITGFTQLALNPNPTSQYLWVSEEIAGQSTTVAKVHIWCSTLPIAVPTIALTPPLP
jgi:hypothetical protein